MSDIFKKIKSIEPEDSASLIALGLHPIEINSNLTLTQVDTDESKTDIEDIDEQEPIKSASTQVDVEAQTAELESEDIDPPFPLAEVKIERATETRNIDNSSIDRNDPVPAFISGEKIMAPVMAPVTSNALFKNNKKDLVNIDKPSVSIVPNPHHYEIYDEGNSKTKVIVLGSLAVISWLIFSAVAGWRLGFVGASNNSVSFLELLTISLFVVLPCLLFILFSIAVYRILGLSKNSARLAQTVNDLMAPDETVVARSAIMTKEISNQVDGLNAKLSAALNRMEMLGDVASLQNAALGQSILASQASTDTISETIETQKSSMTYIAELFESRMATLSTTLSSHADSLSKSTLLAEQKIKEAQMSIEGAANKIDAASNVVRNNSVEAAGTLAGSHAEITQLSEILKARSKEIDVVYRDHANQLSHLIEKLRIEQESLGGALDDGLIKMRDMSLSAQVGAQSLSEASIKGRETVESLADAVRLTDTAVKARFNEMEEMVKYSNSRAESISETAARQVKVSLSQTREEISRIESEMMALVGKMRNAEKPQAYFAPKTPQQITPESSKNLTPKLRGQKPRKPIQIRPVEENKPKPKENITTLGMTQPDLKRVTDIPETIEPKVSTYEVDAFRRPADVEKTETKSSPWSWFSRRTSSDDNDLTIPKHMAEPSQAPALSDAEIVIQLTKLGLSPAAIVDDGSIIEAANIRKAKGFAAMSNVVAKRLSDPVRHLFMALESDNRLKTDIKAFTAQYQARLSPFDNQREAIRQRLETDAGRAFMLCDAALNA